MKKVLYIVLLILSNVAAFAQNTVTLPTSPPTTSFTPQFRKWLPSGNDSLAQIWMYKGTGYNRLYTATEINKFLRTSGSIFNKYADSLYLRTVNLYDNQNISGIKSFIDQIKANGGLSVKVYLQGLNSSNTQTYYINSDNGFADFGAISLTSTEGINFFDNTDGTHRRLFYWPSNGFGNSLWLSDNNLTNARRMLTTWDLNTIDSTFLPKEFVEKDTINSNFNYHFNGYNRVYTPPYYSGISSAERMTDSTIFMVFRTQTSGADSQQGQGVMQKMIYNTRTHTWSAPVTIYTDGSGYDVTAAAVSINPGVRITVFMRRYNLGTSAIVDCGYINSTDGGVTWGAYTTQTGLTTFNTYGKSTKSGSIYLKPVYGSNKCELVSSTDGTTWTYYSTPYNETSPADGALNEPEIENIGTDSVFLTTRTTNGRFWNYLSTDNGLTFSFVGKMPIPTFAMTSAISPEVVYDSDRKTVLVFATGRAAQTSSNAFTKDKSILYVAPKTALTSFKIINEIDRPNPNLKSMGGYNTTVKISTGKYLTIVTDYSPTDTNRVSSTTAGFYGMFSGSLIYSDYNTGTNNLPGDAGFLRLNPKNGNVELSNYTPAFYYNPTAKTISPVNDASFILSSAIATNKLIYSTGKSALHGGRSGDGVSFADGNQGLYSFGWGNGVRTVGESSGGIGESLLSLGKASVTLGSQDTAKADYSEASGRGAVVQTGHTGSYVRRMGGTISGANPIIYSSTFNQFTTLFSSGYRLFTDYVNNLGLFLSSGRVGINITSPASYLDLPANTTTVANMKFTAGTDKTTKVAGEVNFNGTRLALNISTTLKRFVLSDDVVPTTAQTLVGDGTNWVTTTATGTGTPVFATSPVLTGTPTAPTAALGTNTAQVATMAALQAQLTASVGTSARYTASGDGLSTTIVIPHGLTGITSSSLVFVTAKNAPSAGYSYVTTDATNINITYSVAPVLGATNLSYDILIKP